MKKEKTVFKGRMQTDFDELFKATKPLLKYLNNNHHPHVVAIVTPTSVELFEGKMSIPEILDFVKD